MILITTNFIFSFNVLAKNKLIKCKNNYHIESIEYINNEFDEIVIKRHSSSVIMYLDRFGDFHNPLGPAKIVFRKDNSLFCKEHYIDGKLHKEDGPAVTIFYENGTIYREEFYLRGIFHSKERFWERKI